MKKNSIRILISVNILLIFLIIGTILTSPISLKESIGQVDNKGLTNFNIEYICYNRFINGELLETIHDKCFPIYKDIKNKNIDINTLKMYILEKEKNSHDTINIEEIIKKNNNTRKCLGNFVKGISLTGEEDICYNTYIRAIKKGVKLKNERVKYLQEINNFVIEKNRKMTVDEINDIIKKKEEN